MSKAVFVSSIITSTVSHEDLEGFCSVVLPEYPTNWGVDITSFIECVCEESHTGNGQTLVVCQYEKSGNNNESSDRHTGSCDAKFCLFTQQCTTPSKDEFDITQMNPKDLDLQLFDIWCVDTDKSIEIEAPTSTEIPKEDVAPPTTYNYEIESIDKGGENIEEENTVIIETYDVDIEDNALLIRDNNVSTAKLIHYRLSFEVLVAIGLVSDWI